MQIWAILLLVSSLSIIFLVPWSNESGARLYARVGGEQDRGASIIIGEAWNQGGRQRARYIFPRIDQVKLTVHDLYVICWFYKKSIQGRSVFSFIFWNETSRAVETRKPGLLSGHLLKKKN
jgi:hypothetical protein